MSDFTSTNSIIQDWRNLENVNQDNIRILDDNTSIELTSFFSQQPCICNSSIDFTLANLFNMSSSTSTTATFAWDTTIFRFADQAINGYPDFSGFSSTPQTIFASVFDSATSVTVTLGAGVYVCAKLTLIANDAYRGTATAAILTTTQTLPSTQDTIVLFALAVDGTGNLAPYLDANCCYNYLTNINGIFSGYLDVIGNIITNTGKFISYGNSQTVETNIDVDTAFRMTSSTYNRQNILFFDPTITNNPGGIRSINTSDNNFSQIVMVPGYRPIVYAPSDSIGNSGVVVQSDFSCIQYTTSNYTVLVSKSGGSSYSNPITINGEITVTSNGTFLTASILLTDIGINMVASPLVCTGVATIYPVTGSTAGQQAMGYCYNDNSYLYLVLTTDLLATLKAAFSITLKGN